VPIKTVSEQAGLLIFVSAPNLENSVSEAHCTRRPNSAGLRVRPRRTSM